MTNLINIVEDIHDMTWESLNPCTYDDIMNLKVVGGAKVAIIDSCKVWVSRMTENSMVLIIRDRDFPRINIAQEAIMKKMEGWAVLCIPNDGFTQLIVEKNDLYEEARL
jgi:hypothetical protein